MQLERARVSFEATAPTLTVAELHAIEEVDYNPPLSGLLDSAISLIENDHFRFVSSGQIQSLPNASLYQDV
jgi:hypothetical protein